MKAKLQKQLAYKYKEKKVYKHVVVVPDEAITELGWKGGQELEITVINGKLEVKNSSLKEGDQK
jgi:bifunctional DNA-binding transcriptional regulator/antitoxin component of YhaV-PrlF toxin-antitoxin module